jgi:hypothetical protein
MEKRVSEGKLKLKKRWDRDKRRGNFAGKGLSGHPPVSVSVMACVREREREGAGKGESWIGRDR